MTTTVYPAYRPTPGPLQAILLGGTVALFLGALLSDIAYYQSYQIQWANFAAWLIAGGLVFCGLTVLCALISLLRTTPKAGRSVGYFVLLAITWVVGLINAFEHAKDAWAMMPAGLLLSAVVTLLALLAAWIGLNHPRAGVAQ